MEKKELYRHLVDHLPLLDIDREELKTKRGFSDEVIDQCKFRSCSSKLLENFKFSLPENVRKSLSYNTVIVPYFSVTDDIIHIVPRLQTPFNGVKAMNIEGEGVQVFIPYQLLPENIKTLVIAESEYKAVASCMMGVPAVGVPGISTFSKNRFDELKEKLMSLGTEQAVICFDHEIKDNPSYPNFKPDFTKRYDTQFYGFVIAAKLNHSGLPTTIATLEDHWMVNGKADIDGVLAAKIPFSLYTKCIDQAMKIYEYKASWKIPSAHFSFLERRIDKYFYKGPVVERNKCYYFQDSNKKDAKISNFTIEVVYTMQGDAGAERYCQFFSHYGDSTPFVLYPDVMASRQAFLKLCYERGDYEFTGTDAQLQKIWSYIFMNQTGRVIYKVDYFGYNEELKTWFFANGAYNDRGYFPVDKDNTIWIEDTGYVVPTPEDDSTIAAPILSSEEPDFTLKDIYDHLATKMGKPYARTILGWTLGNFFMPEILASYHVYPFLFLHGRMSSGKSTISNWISNFFGFEQKGFPLSGSTVVGIQRVSSQMSMIPVWLEEYRNKDETLAKKNSYLRSIYDKSTIVKGSKKEKEIKAYKARSTLILSGEEHPKDAALNSRCLMYAVTPSEGESNQKSYQWLQGRSSLFNYFGHYILQNKKELWPRIKKAIDDYMEAFSGSKQKIRHRTITHYSVIAGVCEALLGADPAFDLFIGEITAETDTRRENEMALNVFWEDVSDLYGTGKVNFEFYGILHKESEKGGLVSELHIWFSGLYSIWEQNFKGLRNDLPASKAALHEHMKAEPYYLGSRNKRFANNQKTFYCIALDLNHPNFPPTLKTMIQNIEENKKKEIQKDED